MKLSIANLLAAAAWIILPLGYVAPKGEAALLTVLAVAALGLLWRQGRFRWHRGSALCWSAAAIGTVVLASPLWSVAPYRSLAAAGLFLGTGLAAAVLVRAASSLNDAEARWLERMVLVAVSASILLLGAEYVSGGPLTSLVARFKGVRLDPSDNVLAGLANGASVAALLAWPLLAAWRRRAGASAAVLAFAAVMGILWFGTADTTPLAFATGGLVAATVLAAPRIARGAALVAVTVMMLGMPLLPGALPDPQVDDPLMSQLSNSGLHRLVIWRNTAERIAERPLLGYGFDSSRELYGPQSKQEYRLSGRQWAIRSEPIPLHPHNAVLQIWLEMGALGAFAFLAFLVVLVRRIFDGATDPAARAAAMGMLGSALVIGNLSYGAWQSWWLGSLAMGAVMMLAIARASDPVGR